MDATYKTNQHGLPLINVIGTGNIGYPRLKTFYIAGCWVSDETAETYQWFTCMLRDVVWPTDQAATPGVITTDSDSSLMGALDAAFPYATKLLCQIHIRRNFQTNLKSQFSVKEDYASLEKAINTLMKPSFVDEVSENRVIANITHEALGMQLYTEAAKKARNPEKVEAYLRGYVLFVAVGLLAKSNYFRL